MDGQDFCSGWHGPRTPSDRDLVMKAASDCQPCNIVDSIHPPRSSHSYHHVFLPHRRSRRPRSRTAPRPGRIAHPASQPGQNFQRRQRQACRRRRTRPSPRGELRGVHRQVSLFRIPTLAIVSRLCRSQTTRDWQSLPDIHSHAPLHTVRFLSIADIYLQFRYEKEFEGVQDVFELQVISLS